MRFLLKFSAIIISVLLLVSIVRIALGFSHSLTLSDLISIIENVPAIDLSSLLGINLTTSIGTIESWGVFSFIYPIFYALASVIDFVVFALSAVVSVLQWLIYFVAWIFGLPLSGV